MKYFDLHCDTIEELKKRGENFLNSTTQFTIQDQERFEATVQCMAVWVPDSILPAFFQFFNGIAVKVKKLHDCSPCLILCVYHTILLLFLLLFCGIFSLVDHLIQFR